MAIFFHFKTQAESRAGVVCTKWHSKHPLLAVSTYASPDGTEARVTIYNEEGEKVGTRGPPKEKASESTSLVCSCLGWHPRSKLLLCGWKDGSLTLWGEKAEDEKEIQSPHDMKGVSIIQWSALGDKVLTADKNGMWVVWKYDKSTLTQLHSNREAPLDGALTHAVLQSYGKEQTPEGEEQTKDAKGGKLSVEDEDGDGLAEYSNALGGAFAVTKFSQECTWFLGCSSGDVIGVDEDGNSGVIFNMDKQPVVGLLYNVPKHGLVAMNQTCHIAYYTMMDDQRWMLQTRFRVAFGKGADTSSIQMVWAGNGLLAVTAAENIVRLWNMEDLESYVLQAEGDSDTKPNDMKITCTSFNPTKRVLCGGLREGRILVWQYTGGEMSKSEEDWELFAEIKLDAPVSNLSWGPGETLLSASMSEGVSILHETVLKRRLWRNTVAVQLTPDTLQYEDLNTKTMLVHRAQIKMKGIDVSGNHLVVWSDKQIELFSIQAGGINSVGTLNTENTGVALHADKLLVGRNEKGIGCIEVYSLLLQKMSNMSIKAVEGAPTHLSINGDFLAAATSKGVLKYWWIGGRSEERYPTSLWDGTGKEIVSIALNCNGTKIALIAKGAVEGGHVSVLPTIFVHDLDNDTSLEYSMKESSRYPVSLFWDEQEPRLLACETRKRKQSEKQSAEAEEEGTARMEVVTVFAAEKAVYLQDHFPIEKPLTALIGICAPSLYFYTRETKTAMGETTNVVVRKLRDFDGISCDTDPAVKEAIMEFSFHLACGDMDSAYRAVKLIKDENVWNNMAVVCVKTRRLDVAEVCLGNMLDAKGAQALREARKEPEGDAHVAMLAIQLGQVEEAERLYTKCGRYDLLNKMYQACGKWEQAIQTAEQFDRIHLRSIYYEYARNLEFQGNIDEAVKAYEKAKCHGFEVPRMMYNANMIEDLEKYVRKVHDREIYTWWAQFCESNGQYELALRYYAEAGDTLSRVRLHCALRDLDAAAALILSPESNRDVQAAAFHLARQYEEQGRVKEALQYFRIAKAFRNAIRIARQNDMEGEVMQLSLQADLGTIIESAMWFEENNILDKAVILYQKGGELAKAIELCVKGELYSTLQQLADNLDKDTDSEVFIQCAEYFLNKNQNEKAVQMYIQAKGYNEALQICVDRGVKLTEEMAEEMTLPKTNDEDYEAQRISLLKKIAKVAKIQESWHLACKKYTQAGDRLKGMKVLLKSGDTQKIIFFTNHSRQKDIYIVAANYLQTLDWHNPDNGEELTKHIIRFYQQARAYESLAGFFDAMAQADVDDFRDYEKAVGALKESYKYLEKSNAQNKEAKLQQLAVRINYVEQFVDARNMVRTDPGKMVSVCQGLLEVEDIDGAVRVGDVYALLVEFYVGQHQYELAYQLIEKMRQRQIVLSYYLESQLVESVYQAMGVEYVEQDIQGTSHQAPPPEDEVGEEISADGD
eukprot:Sspe_Gene.9975::Locus_3352_Transcript_1_1_Confidence_1.000_Length_4513::g.9975::m.9975/K19672/IFT140; intraflagellar transport protein 140